MKEEKTYPQLVWRRLPFFINDAILKLVKEDINKEANSKKDIEITNLDVLIIIKQQVFRL